VLAIEEEGVGDQTGNDGRN